MFMILTKKAKNILFHIWLILIVLVLCGNNYTLAATSLFKKDIVLTNSYSLNIEETETESVKINLYKGDTIVDSIRLDQSKINSDLIQKLELNDQPGYEFLITTYFTFTTYQAQQNIIVWKNSKDQWNLLLCPFTQGFAEDRNDDGIYEIVEYYGGQKIYNFHNGYFAKVGDNQFYDENLIIESYGLDKPSDHPKIEGKTYLSELCKLTKNEEKNLVLIKKFNNAKKASISAFIGKKEFKIDIADVTDLEDFKINIIDLKYNVSLGHPQLLLEFFDGKRYRYLYTLAWINDHFEIVFKHILFDELTQDGYAYEFYIEDRQDKISVWNQEGYKIFLFDNKNGYVQVLDKSW